MNKKEFISKILEARRLISGVKRYSVCEALGDVFEGWALEQMSIPTKETIYKGSRRATYLPTDCLIEEVFRYFFRPYKRFKPMFWIESSPWAWKEDEGYDGYIGYWLGERTLKGQMRRVFWLEMFEQWFISEGYYKKLVKQ